MKRIYSILLAGVTLLAVMSCGNSGKKTEAVQKKAATVEITDWDVFDLKGKVKSVTYYNWSSPYMWPYNDNVRTYSFDVTGNVIAPKGVTVTRNQRGVAIDFLYYLPDWDSWFSQSLKYDSNGRLAGVDRDGVDGGSSSEFHYDENGRISKETKYECAEGDEWEVVKCYEYISFDAKGNWTKRICRETPIYIGAEPSTVTQTRQIVYYE